MSSNHFVQAVLTDLAVHQQYPPSQAATDIHQKEKRAQLAVCRRLCTNYRRNFPP